MPDQDDPVAPPGDIYTAPGRHPEGLTALSAEVVKECNRLGILSDLAHGTDATVRGALKVSTKPMLISHTGLRTAGDTDDQRRRTISVELARDVAGAGGVLGISWRGANSLRDYMASRCWSAGSHWPRSSKGAVASFHGRNGLVTANVNSPQLLVGKTKAAYRRAPGEKRRSPEAGCKGGAQIGIRQSGMQGDDRGLPPPNHGWCVPGGKVEGPTEPSAPGPPVGALPNCARLG